MELSAIILSKKGSTVDVRLDSKYFSEVLYNMKTE